MCFLKQLKEVGWHELCFTGLSTHLLDRPMTQNPPSVTHSFQAKENP